MGCCLAQKPFDLRLVWRWIGLYLIRESDKNKLVEESKDKDVLQAKRAFSPSRVVLGVVVSLFSSLPACCKRTKSPDSSA